MRRIYTLLVLGSVGLKYKVGCNDSTLSMRGLINMTKAGMFFFFQLLCMCGVATVFNSHWFIFCCLYHLGMFYILWISTMTALIMPWLCSRNSIFMMKLKLRWSINCIWKPSYVPSKMWLSECETCLSGLQNYCVALLVWHVNERTA